MNDKGYSGSTILLTFLAGAAVGAVAALLTAPKSGRETRDDIKNWGRRVAGTASRVPNAVRTAYSEGATAASEAFRESMRSSTAAHS